MILRVGSSFVYCSGEDSLFAATKDSHSRELACDERSLKKRCLFAIAGMAVVGALIVLLVFGLTGGQWMRLGSSLFELEKERWRRHTNRPPRTCGHSKVRNNSRLSRTGWDQSISNRLAGVTAVSKDDQASLEGKQGLWTVARFR